MLVLERASMLVSCHNGGGHERYCLGLHRWLRKGGSRGAGRIRRHDVPRRGAAGGYVIAVFHVHEAKMRSRCVAPNDLAWWCDGRLQERLLAG